MKVMDKVDRIVRPVYNTMKTGILLFGATGCASVMGYISDPIALTIMAVGSGFAAAYFTQKEFKFLNAK